MRAAGATPRSAEALIAERIGSAANTRCPARGACRGAARLVPAVNANLQRSRFNARWNALFAPKRSRTRLSLANIAPATFGSSCRYPRNSEFGSRARPAAAPARPDERITSAARPPARFLVRNGGIYVVSPSLLLLAAHVLVTVPLNVSQLYLRVASFAIPLPFGMATYALSKIGWRDAFGLGALTAIVSVITMLAVIANVDGTPWCLTPLSNGASCSSMA